ncbi:MAG: efflux RND transporter permease subunit [Gammaproteobacteria bacterium]|nr:efflux RND transporter permease subunit [Gammaproteobacteria bacterium]
MASESARSTRLETSSTPSAVVHEGFFVFANRAFLDKLGFASLDELIAVPLLDLVNDRDHAKLREHLDSAKKTAGTDKHLPEVRLLLHRADELPLSTSLRSFRTRFGGEDCVQIDMSTPEDLDLAGRLKAAPWRQYLSVFFLTLFTILPSTLLLQLNIDNSPTVYFPDDQPAVVLDRELRERFPNDRVFVLMFEGVALFSDGFVHAYDELTKRLEKSPAITKVVTLTNQDYIRGTTDEFVVEKLIDPGELNRYSPDARAQRARDGRFSRRALISEDGSAVAMVVIPVETGNSLERLALEDQIRQEVENARLTGYLSAVAGQIAVDSAQLRSMLRDNMIFIPATVAIGLSLIWWLYRRLLAVILAGVAIGVVVNSTMAIYVLLNQPFTLISSIIPPLLSALTVAAIVHLFNALLITSKAGLSGEQRVKRAVELVGRPAFFAAITTAGGLASLATSPIVPIKTFGLISAAGTLFIFVVVFRVLPNVLVRWDRKPWRTVRNSSQRLDQVVAALSRVGLRHPLLVVGVSAVLLAAGAPQIAKVTVETNLLEFFDTDHRIRHDTQRIDDVMVGTMPVSIIFNAREKGGLQDPVNLRLIRDFQQWATAQPEIDRSIGPADFVEEMHWGFHAEDPAYRTIPADKRLISQYLLIYDGEDMFDFVDRDFTHSQIALNLNVHSANDITQTLDRIRAYLGEQQSDGLDWEIAGDGRLFADMEDLLVYGQVFSLWGALGLIFVFMLILLRSLWAAALCMIPNMSPLFLIFVVMGISGIWLDVATAMIASVAIGIAVDDTIHVYHGFHRRIRAGTHPLLALVRTYRIAGKAVVTTTLILSAQFLMLVFSDFVPTRNFGMLTAAGLIAALLFDLLLLPALLIIIYGDNSPVADWLARLRGRRPAQIAEEFDEPETGVDESYWTPDRKTALVKQVLGGGQSTAAAAREYALPEAEVNDWVRSAEQGINEALGGRPSSPRRDPAKVRALARAYKKLQDENRELKDRLDDA